MQKAGRGQKSGMFNADDAAQAEVIGLLLSGKAFPDAGPVMPVQTRWAHAFLRGDVALRINRTVRYDWRAPLNRASTLSRPAIQMIYRDTGRRGGLEPDGAGRL